MKKHNYEQMLSLYSQWQASGKSKTEFAISQGIRPTTFYYWTRKFEQVEPDSASGFHRISIEEPSYKNQEELMAAIQYPSGIRLELYSSFQNLSGSYVQLLKTLTE
jgi:hypothetical protein